MTTILIKKKDTAGAPGAGDLTNAAGGTEIAVNTATKRIYSKDSGGNVIELGTNPSGTTMAGNLLFSPDNTYDIGASGATRPRTLYLGTSLIAPAITNTGLTSGRVVFSTTNGLETDSAGLTFDGTNFATTGTATAAKLIPTGSSATGNGLYLPAANSVGISTNGTNAVYIDSSQNVGIGTSSPDVKLQTNGIIKSGATGTNGEIQLARTSDGLGVGKVTMTESTQIMNYNNLLGSGVHSFTINTVERMRIDSSGNVGIGSSSPASAASRTLTVQNGGADGTVSITAGDYSSAASMLPMVQTLGNRYDSNQTFGGRFAASFRRSDTVAIASGHNLGYYAFGGQWGTDTTYQSAKLLYAASIIGVAEGSFTSATAMPTAITFCTGSTGGAIQSPNTAYGTERMRISSTGIVTMSAYGAGAATFSAAGVISSVSDETWKIKDGVPVDPDSMLKKLEPGYWYYNDEKKEIFGVDRQLGFYAQNVNAAIGPEAAPTPEEGKPWGYYDRSVLAVTVMSLQKALATIESLTARIEALEST